MFSAISIVNNEAPYSKAFQNSHTILLSDDASIVTKPHLEIKIDELEASHGVTTGTLDDEQLLYLCSRGIPYDLAQDMLLDAFEVQILEKITNEQIQEFIKNHIKSLYV